MILVGFEKHTKLAEFFQAIFMQRINWGIIGCGNVTEMKSGPAFSKVDGSRLVAVMSRNADKACDYARRQQRERPAHKLVMDKILDKIAYESCC